MDQHPNLPPTDNSLIFESQNKYTFLPKGRNVPFINGAKWIDQAVKMMVQQPKMWLIVILIFVGFDLINDYVLANSSPMKIASLFLTTLLSAGVVCIAESQRLTGSANLQLISKGFNERFGGIITLIFIQIGIILAGLILSLGIIGIDSLNDLSELIYAAENNNQERVTEIILLIGVGRIIASVLFFVISLFLAEIFSRFAIPLMMLENYSVGQAIVSSFKGCLKNIPAAIVYLISICVLLAIYLTLENYFPTLENVFFVLWSVVVVPCTHIATYVAYRDIFYRN